MSYVSAADFGYVDPSIAENLAHMQEDDPLYIRDILLKNPSHLALVKERNPSLASALLSGDKGDFFFYLLLLHQCHFLPLPS